MATTLPDRLIVPSRDDLTTQWKNDVNFRAPAISTDTGTLPDIDANVEADIVLPIFSESSRQADVETLDGQDSTQLNTTCRDLGIPTKLPATGSSGYVNVSTAAGGATIAQGQEIKHLPTGLRWTCAVGGVYTSSTPVPIVGTDMGPQTNLPFGTVLTWSSPPAGLLAQATVFRDSENRGLTGGADVETDDEQRNRIRNARAFPAVSGNDAAYQKAALETPGVALGAAFTYPCDLGSGTTSVAILLRPATSGASRIPNNVQIGLVRGYVTVQMAKDDSASYPSVLSSPVDLKLGVVWAQGAASWTDSTSAWPPAAAGTYDYAVSASVDATHFTISTTDPFAVAPQAGLTIGFFVEANVVASPDNVFVRKRILSVTGSNPWTIVVDTANNASDTTYTPAVGDRAMPWSDSLALLSPSVVSYFDGLGPGEEFATFFDDGYRQRRNPPDPKTWPKSLTNKSLIGIEELDAIEDVAIVSPATPHDPPIGTPGVLVYLLTLNSLSVYPKA